MSYYNKVDRTMTQFTKLCLRVQGYTALHAVITSYESALFLSLKYSDIRARCGEIFLKLNLCKLAHKRLNE